MVFTRRFFMEAASAFSAWAGFGGPEKDRRLERLTRSPHAPVPDPGCNEIYSVGVTMSGHDVKSGEALWQNCQGQTKVVGMALTDAKRGEPVTVMIGYVPQSARG